MCVCLCCVCEGSYIFVVRVSVIVSGCFFREGKK